MREIYIVEKDTRGIYGDRQNIVGSSSKNLAIAHIPKCACCLKPTDNIKK